VPESPVDVAAALGWAGSELGSPVVSSAPLDGGMTSTMLGLRHDDGTESVLRLMTNEPWRTHGAELTARERAAQLAMAATPVPAPTSLALDAEGVAAGAAAHLMSRLPGAPLREVDAAAVQAMADLLATIHGQQPATPFRTFQSWAWPAKWVVPAWSRHPESWRRAFAVLAGPAPAYAPTFLHRDFGHRNLLWSGGGISGVVDWVETSTGPAWLDAAHAASNLAVLHDLATAQAFLDAYAAVAVSPADPYWLVMDAVGYLPPPGKASMFGAAGQLERLDDWLHHLVDGS
jgi:aminoglycoside phosphotransferase (APT) family kinase protein